MEFDVPGHKFSLNNLASVLRDASKDLVIDDIDAAYELAKRRRVCFTLRIMRVNSF